LNRKTYITVTAALFLVVAIDYTVNRRFNLVR